MVRGHRLRPASLFSCSNLKCCGISEAATRTNMFGFFVAISSNVCLPCVVQASKKVRQKLSLSLLRLPFGRPDPPLFPVRQASDVAAWARQTRDEPAAERVRRHDEYDWVRARDGQQSSCAWATWAAKDRIDTARQYEACSCRRTIRADDWSARRGVNQATPEAGRLPPLARSHCPELRASDAIPWAAPDPSARFRGQPRRSRLA